MIVTAVRRARRRISPAALAALSLLAGVACSSGAKSSGGAASCTPSFAPGNQALLLTRDQSLYIRNMKTGASCKLLTAPTGKFVTYPVWSPDGKQMLYIFEAPFQGNLGADYGDDVYLADEANSNPSVLIQHDKSGVQYESPSWMPNGQRLIISYFFTELDAQGAYKGQTYESRWIDMSSKAVSSGAPNVNGTNLCRDGSLLTYVDFNQDDFSSNGIWISNPDASNAHAVVTSANHPEDNFQAFYAPVFSPDCKQIVFATVSGTLSAPPSPSKSLFARLLDLFKPAGAAAHGPPWDLWIANADGSNLRRLTHLNEDLPYAQWSDDGQTIVFIGTTGLYQMGPDGTGLKKIDQGAVHGQIAWRR